MSTRTRSTSIVVVLGLAILALLMTATGQAVAVSAQPVQIVDATTMSRIAKVDSVGRLLVNVPPPTSTLHAGQFTFVGTTPLTSPTKATLAVSRLAVFNNGSNSSFPSTNFTVRLVKLTPRTTGGSCSDATASQPVSVHRSAIGTNTELLFPQAIRFVPTAGTPYCIGVTLAGENGDPGSYFLPFVELSTSVVSGTYTGAGTPSAAAAPEGADSSGAPFVSGDATPAGKPAAVSTAPVG